MPMIESDSPEAREENFHEFRHGKTYSKTRHKFGKKRANKQMIAAVLNAGRSGKKKKSHSGRGKGRAQRGR